jgi:dihydroorotate dehydrogenase (fumarate)
MTDLTTTYLGLSLQNPLVASASPLSEKVDMVKKLEQAGVSAVVMYSLFEEQVIHESLELDHYLFTGTEISPEFDTIYPQTGHYVLKPEAYLDQIVRLKKAVQIPIIGSLNGVSTGGWIKYAKQIESAGADALELNIYYLPTDPSMTASALEENYVSLVRNIRNSIHIPLAVKLSPFFTVIPNIARRLVEAGANGLVLFNRFYQPDFDLENLEVVPNLILSRSDEIRLPMRWIAILYGRLQADLALTSGIHTAEDVIKGMMAGASATMMTSALLQKGPDLVPGLLKDLGQWMKDHEYESVRQMIGVLSQKSLKDPAAFERANYMKVLSSFRSLP